MSQAIVEQVDREHPTLLQANTHQTDAHFLYFCCQALGPNWRLLSKSAGENGYTWPNGIRTSHDAIFRVNAEGQKVEGIDAISGAGSGSPTSPSWSDIPPSAWRPSNLPIALSQVPAPPGAGDPGQPGDPCAPCKADLAKAQAKVKELEAALASSVPKTPYPGDPVWDAFGQVYESDVRRAGQTLNAQSFRWAGRTIHDDYMEGLTLQQSIAKHRKEWCDVLGIPVEP